MPPARGKTAPPEEPVIPDSDDLPDDESAPSVEEAASGEITHRDQPHAHRHTPGYPAHVHDGTETEYDESDTFVHGGPAAFGQERHDADVHSAQSLHEDLQTAQDETPVLIAARLAEDLRANGWQVDEYTHPNQPSGVILGIQRHTRPISITIGFTE